MTLCNWTLAEQERARELRQAMYPPALDLDDDIDTICATLATVRDAALVDAQKIAERYWDWPAGDSSNAGKIVREIEALRKQVDHE
jgi:hypothetical protein